MELNVNDFLQSKAKTDFGILKKWTNYSVKKDEDFEEQICNLIKINIEKMLSEDFQGLLNFLYKNDIDENLIKQIMDGSFQDEIALKISKIYIERLKKKHKTWHHYNDNSIIGDY